MNRRDCLKYAGLSGAALAATAIPGLAAAPTIRFRDLYSSGTNFSAAASKLNGQTIQMRGFAAPPLKPDIDFFVLTRFPQYKCPFCDTEAEWPANIIVVETKLDIPTDVTLLDLRGKLSLGTKTDPRTGFVSRVRLEDARF